uniref:Succinate dehydrogenase assembly factor 3, mitochondrial n=1 Tax=Rodentolepis nana TaxID=102285 RepID=A0A0R3TGT9_RODNA
LTKLQSRLVLHQMRLSMLTPQFVQQDHQEDLKLKSNYFVDKWKNFGHFQPSRSEKDYNKPTKFDD